MDKKECVQILKEVDAIGCIEHLINGVKRLPKRHRKALQFAIDNLQEQPREVSKSKLEKARGILFAYFNEHDYELLEDCLIALTPLFEPLEE